MKAEFTFRFLLTLLSASFIAAAAAFSRSTGSVIVNGSFEQGPAARTFLNLQTGNSSSPGWIVTGEGVDYVTTGYWISSDGERSIDLDGSERSRKMPPLVQGGIAQTLATRLADNGIAAARVTAKGFGSSVPVATNETPDGRQRNRRVEVRLKK